MDVFHFRGDKLFPFCILHFPPQSMERETTLRRMKRQKTNAGISPVTPEQQLKPGQEHGAQLGCPGGRHSPVPVPVLPEAGLTSGGRRLSVGVSHALHGGGGHAHGHSDPLPQDRGGQVHHRHVPEHPRVQLPPGTHTKKPHFKRLQQAGN